MHPTTTLAAAANTVCNWSCQFQKGWDSDPTPAWHTGASHSGTTDLIILAVVAVLVLWALSKIRRIAA
jgi:hypothetical protein